jgi:hypothetical protein
MVDSVTAALIGAWLFEYGLYKDTNGAGDGRSELFLLK